MLAFSHMKITGAPSRIWLFLTWQDTPLPGQSAPAQSLQPISPIVGNPVLGIFDAGIVAIKRGNSDPEIRGATPGIDLDTPFCMGSVGKQICGVLALRCLGKRLDATVSEFLIDDDIVKLKNEMPKDQNINAELMLSHLNKISIRQLLTHTAPIDYCSLAQINGHNYQNLNYCLVGRILEKVTGKSYEELLNEIFREAGMNDTSPYVDDNNKDFLAKVNKSFKVVDPEGTVASEQLIVTQAVNGGIRYESLLWRSRIRKLSIVTLNVINPRKTCQGVAGSIIAEEEISN
jgi:CubicO group peptidase (beta-lactamase class C family)